jgi:formylglycine-generating enzyme required for sulfatase activity
MPASPVIRFFSAVLVLAALPALAEVDFMIDIKPILEHNCVSCHQATKAKGKLRIDTKEHAFKHEGFIVPGKPDDSSVYWTTALEADDEEIMPPMEHATDYLMPKNEQDLLKEWVASGAKWPDGVTLKSEKRLPKTVEFAKHVQPMLEEKCVKCHLPEYKDPETGKTKKPKGDLIMTTRKLTMETGENGDCLVPGDAKKSSVWTLVTLDPEDDEIMPPKGDPLAPREIAMLRRWIEQGADWPEDIVLEPRKPIEKGIFAKDVYRRLGLGSSMDKYTETIPGTDFSFDMAPIPGGTFAMGSADAEKGRGEDESPVHQVSIEPFWMATHELTWKGYELWGLSVDAHQRKHDKKYVDTPLDKLADAVSNPTEPYTDMTFGMGKKDRPAICMTQLSAKMYCMWLSAKTGKFYRLPTEAEWEYACRAGTTTAYHFGDDASKLGEYAWFEKNSGFQYQIVGKKKPNPWGLYDMHGNVSEWCLDQYDAAYYKKLAGKTTASPLNIPTELYPRVARGGSWDDPPAKLRSAARRGSDEEWKQQDPQIPKSVWYHTDALFNGFRVIRPLNPPSAEDIEKYWPSEAEQLAIPKR